MYYLICSKILNTLPLRYRLFIYFNDLHICRYVQPVAYIIIKTV